MTTCHLPDDEALNAFEKKRCIQPFTDNNCHQNVYRSLLYLLEHMCKRTQLSKKKKKKNKENRKDGQTGRTDYNKL